MQAAWGLCLLAQTFQPPSMRPAGRGRHLGRGVHRRMSNLNATGCLQAGPPAQTALPAAATGDMSAGVWLSARTTAPAPVARRHQPGRSDRFIEVPESPGVRGAALTGGDRSARWRFLTEQFRLPEHLRCRAGFSRDHPARIVPVRSSSRGAHPAAVAHIRPGWRWKPGARCIRRTSRYEGRRHRRCRSTKRQHLSVRQSSVGRLVLSQHRHAHPGTGTCCSRCGWPISLKLPGPTDRRLPLMRINGVPVLSPDVPAECRPCAPGSPKCASAGTPSACWPLTARHDLPDYVVSA